MKKLFYKEVPLVEAPEDAPQKKETLKKLARKVEKFTNDHPIVAASIAIGTVNVVAYGLLAAVTATPVDSDSEDDFETEIADSE